MIGSAPFSAIAIGGGVNLEIEPDQGHQPSYSNEVKDLMFKTSQLSDNPYGTWKLAGSVNIGPARWSAATPLEKKWSFTEDEAKRCKGDDGQQITEAAFAALYLPKGARLATIKSDGKPWLTLKLIAKEEACGGLLAAIAPVSSHSAKTSANSRKAMLSPSDCEKALPTDFVSVVVVGNSLPEDVFLERKQIIEETDKHFGWYFVMLGKPARPLRQCPDTIRNPPNPLALDQFIAQYIRSIRGANCPPLSF
jgi:hypothetical protein